MFVVVLSLSNTVLSTTYKQYTENYSVALDDDAECANFCFQGGLDYQKNSGNETLVFTTGVIDKKRERIYHLAGKPLTQSSCKCTVTTKYKE